MSKPKLVDLARNIAWKNHLPLDVAMAYAQRIPVAMRPRPSEIPMHSAGRIRGELYHPSDTDDSLELPWDE